ncbi:MAG: DUF1579 family protein [Betaproteobacteria bacterium]|nr:DUF1579 family protein [Betaproteobacteria bacterium]
MPLPPRFASLSGEWKGTKRLYLNGEAGPEKLSGSRATIAKAVRGTFLLVDYSWKFESDPHEGVLLLGYEEKQNVATAAWGIRGTWASESCTAPAPSTRTAYSRCVAAMRHHPIRTGAGASR